MKKLTSLYLGIIAGLLVPPTYAEELFLEEVIVTAQKREQSVQDVPIAISAFSEEFLTEAGVDDVLELQFFVPGLTIANSQSASQTNFNIRGVGTAGNSLSLESSVGLYIDGVYRSRQSSGIGDLVDIQRIEVLKGPQGTLFGKNTASGAVQFLTRKPDLDGLGGFIELQAGNERYQNFKAALNVPVVEGTSAIRVSLGSTKRDGYVDNITTGSDINDRDRYSVRGQFLYNNGEDLSVRVIADYSELDEKCCSGTNSFDGPGDTTAGFVAAGGDLANPANQLAGASFVLPLDIIAGATQFSGAPVVLANQLDDYRVATDIDPFADIEEKGISLEINYDISETMTFTSITSQRSYKAASFVDADFNALDILSASGGNTDQDTFTQEFRIDGAWGDKVIFVAGVYYFNQDLDNETTLQLGSVANLLLAGNATTAQAIAAQEEVTVGFATTVLCPFLQITDAVCNGPAFPRGEGSDNISAQEQTSWAVFAQADVELSEELLLTVGLRYLDEEKDMDVNFTETIFTPVFNAFTPLAPEVPNVNGVKFEDEDITGTIKLSYFPSDGIMAYLSYGKGYKSGGTNIDRISPATGAPLVFEPETSDSYEVGIKADLLDSRLRVNLAIHLTDFDQFQANTFVGTGFVLQNAGEIRSRGFEVDVVGIISQWLSITGGMAYVDAEYESFEGGSCIRTPFGSSPDQTQPNFPDVCDASGNTVAGTPEWTYYMSFIAERELAGGYLFGRLDVNYHDEIPSGTDLDPNKEGDAFALANIKVGYRFAEDKYEVSIWAKNAFDEDYKNGAFNSVIREGSLTSFHTEPRTYGLTLRANFNN